MSFGTICPACLSLYLSVCIVACPFWKMIKVCCYQCRQSYNNSYRISSNNPPPPPPQFYIVLKCCAVVMK